MMRSTAARSQGPDGKGRRSRPRSAAGSESLAAGSGGNEFGSERNDVNGTASEWFLAVSLFGAAVTMLSLARIRHAGPLVPLNFFARWLSSELPLFHIGWQAIATLIFAANGAIDEPLGVLALAICFLSWAGLVMAQFQALPAGGIFESALAAGLGSQYREVLSPDRLALLADVPRARDVIKPFSFDHPAVERIPDVAYGEAGKRNRLDIYRPKNAPDGGAPILLQIHGGAWVIGEKEQQGRPLMTYLAERGWVCFAINYQLGPKVRFPEFLIDCKRALAWVKEHAHEYGGDPDFVAVTGGSAGGHLSSLVALTANDARFQPGFEQADTSVQAAVPFYGIYDFLDRENVRGRSSMKPFLEKFAMPCKADQWPDLWEAASPISHITPEAPPFFVIHGTHDSLAFVEDAQLFVEKLRNTSRAPVVYAELPGCEHAFDVFHSWRSSNAVRSVARFLEVQRAIAKG